MAVFPTDFAAQAALRTTKLLSDDGSLNGTITPAQIFALLQGSDILQQLLSLDDVVEDVASTVTAYTIVAGDRNKLKRFLSSAACTISVPLGLPVGFTFNWLQQGAGVLSFVSAGGAGQTLQSIQGFKSGGQYSRGTIECVAANTWNLSGYTAV